MISLGCVFVKDLPRATTTYTPLSRISIAALTRGVAAAFGRLSSARRARKNRRVATAVFRKTSIYVRHRELLALFGIDKVYDEMGVVEHVRF